VKRYEKERAQRSTELQTEADRLLHDSKVLKSLPESSAISENRERSLTDVLQRPYTDWEDVSTRAHHSSLINVESGKSQGR
jgi:hypothetical protein